MGIQINVIAGQTVEGSSVDVSGSTSELLTDSNKTNYGIKSSELLRAVKAYYGKKPDQACTVYANKKWAKNYKTYNWPEVHSVVVPVSAKIISITSEPAIVSTTKAYNGLDHQANVNVQISSQVSNTTSSSYNKQQTVEVSQEFEYGFSFLGTGGKGKTGIKYSNSWGKTKTDSSTYTVGSEAGADIPLEAGERVVVDLTASRGKMIIEIEYKTYLTGSTACNYSSKYKGHHFYGFNINSVMKAGNIKNGYTTKETIEVGFYSDMSIDIKPDNSSKSKTMNSRQFKLVDTPEGKTIAVPVEDKEMAVLA